MKTISKVTTVILGLLVGSVASATPPGTATPWGEEDGGARVNGGDLHLTVQGVDAKESPGVPAASLSTSLQDGADHIISQQCGASGGFCWPHGSACCPTGPTNITAPIVQGIMAAYRNTGDPTHLAAAVAGGDYDLTTAFPNMTPAFGSHTPGFLHALTQLTGDSTYSSFAETGFFDALSAGTYGDASVGSWAAYAPADTFDFIARHKANRSGVLINLRPWDMQYMPWVAGLIGNATSGIDTTVDAIDQDSDGNDGEDAGSQQDMFRDLSILDGLNTLDNTTPLAGPWWDMLGLAGGVHALALNGTTTFPAISAPKFAAINGIDNLCDLTAVLAGFQNANGSWYWSSGLASPTTSDEDTQTTAYAVLALFAADVYCTNYNPAISDGRDWILTMQLGSGGFLSYPGGTENVEVEGESLSALFTGSACGNGAVDGGETCDDGNSVDNDGCRNDCTFCGDGIVNMGAGETCDDGNLDETDSCFSDCTKNPAFVPAVSEWGLIVMALVAFVLGTVLYGRRRVVKS